MLLTQSLTPEQVTRFNSWVFDACVAPGSVTLGGITFLFGVIVVGGMIRVGDPALVDSRQSTF